MSDEFTDTVDDTFEEPPPPKPRSLRERYLGQDLRPAERLARLMLWHSCPAGLRRSIKLRRQVIVVVEVPGSEWMDLIFEAARRLFGSAEYLRNSKNSSTQDAALRSAVATNQSVVIATSDGLDGIHEGVRASMDYRLEVKRPDHRIIARTIRATFGTKSVAGIPENIGRRASPTALLATIRRHESAGRAVARLKELDRRMKAKPGKQPSGSCGLEALFGYGPAKDWGLQLASDIQAYRRGEIDWTEISSAALLHGEPGVGKTFFAGALARSCRIPMITTSMGRIFSDTAGHLGDVVRRLTRVFEEARDAAPSLLFVDELDALPDREALSRHGRDWWTTVVNHFLKLLDDDRAGVVVLGATNAFDRIDGAILRSGRLDQHFRIERPGESDLAEMLRHHLGDRLPDADLPMIARLAHGASGADVELLVKTAAATARREERELSVNDILTQLIRDELTDEELKRISVHEAGHAVVAMALGRKVHHISTIRRGRGLGNTTMDPNAIAATRAQLEEEVLVDLAGRNAELLVFGDACNGAGADLRNATLCVASIHGSLGLGASLLHRADSAAALVLLDDPHFRDLIDEEMRILDARCMVIVTSRHEQIRALAQALQARRVLSGDEVDRIINP